MGGEARGRNEVCDREDCSRGVEWELCMVSRVREIFAARRQISCGATRASTALFSSKNSRQFMWQTQVPGPGHFVSYCCFFVREREGGQKL